MGGRFWRVEHALRPPTLSGHDRPYVWEKWPPDHNKRRCKPGRWHVHASRSLPALGNIYAPGAKTIHIDLNAYEIAKNHPVELGFVADPKLTLAKLGQLLVTMRSSVQQRAALNRVEQIGSAKQDKHHAALEKDSLAHDVVPVSMARFMEELAPQLPEDVVIFDEALTSSPAVVRYALPKRRTIISSLEVVLWG